MSLTSSDRRYLAICSALPAGYRCIVDDAFEAVKTSIVNADTAKVALSWDDRAAHFEAAIVRYLIESNPDDAAIKAAIEEVDSE